MSEDQFSDSGAKIKDVIIPLPNFNYYHSPSTASRGVEEAPNFVGRTELQKKLKHLITDSSTNSGAYLVTGYRGMGKTSLVRRVIRDIKENPNENRKKGTVNLVNIEISLSQNSISDFQVLKLISRSLLTEYEKFNRPFQSQKIFMPLRGFWDWFLIKFLHLLILTFILYFVDSAGLPEFIQKIPLQKEWISYEDSQTTKWILLFLIGVGISYLLSRIPRIFDQLGYVSTTSILERMREINNRIDVEEVKESSNPLSAIPSVGSLFRGKVSKTTPPISPKELESQLIQIFFDLRSSPFSIRWRNPKFIFVFDELDKLDTGTDSSDEKSRNPQKGTREGVRSSQMAVSQVFTNLKHFLNVAEAKFIFIAGREMYDAALADISDRDSFIGSIFHDVLYVPSFYKDGIKEESGGITSMAEHYLCKFLYDFHPARNFADGHKIEYDLASYYKLLKNSYRLLSEKNGETFDNDWFGSVEGRKARKTIYLLQNFIIYLTYRSHGTPKKMSHLFEKYIKKYDEENIRELATDHLVMVNPHNPKGKIEPQFYLHFNYEDQYNFSIISYLFRPYLITHSRYIKGYGDKVLVSTGYLIDHIFKFHNTAFNWSHLELTPEVISPTRAPQLREYIERLVSSLQKSHIRETQFGLFQFKFFNKTQKEIAYLSITNEQEAAAFNFTLDETYSIKRHYLSKLDELLEKGNLYPSDKSQKFISSISFVYSILGDLSFFDQEYDDAIMYYNESVLYLENRSADSLSVNDFSRLVKEKLKIALCHEKMKDNEIALGIIEEVMYGTLNYFGAFKNKARHPQKNYLGNPLKPFNSRSLNSTMIMGKSVLENTPSLVLSISARLFLLEKHSPTGLIGQDLVHSELVFRTLIEMFLDKDSSQNYLVRAIYHLQVGNLLFYKNGKVLIDPQYSLTKGWSEHNKKYNIDFLARLEKENGYNFQSISGKKLPIDYPINNEAQNEYRAALHHILMRLAGYHHRSWEIDSDLPFYTILVEVSRYVFPTTEAKYPFDFTQEKLKETVNRPNRAIYNALGECLSKLGDLNLSRICSSDLNWVEFIHFWEDLLNCAPRFYHENKANYQSLTNNFEQQRFLQHFSDEIESFQCEILVKIFNSSFYKKNEELAHTFICYFLSGLAYLNAGKQTSHGFQLKKILITIKDLVAISPSENLEASAISPFKIENLFDRFKACILRLSSWAYQAVNWSSDTSGRPQIFKLKEFIGTGFSDPSGRELSEEIYKAISQQPVLREISMLGSETLFKFSFKSKLYSIKSPDCKFINNLSHIQNIICPYSVVTSRFTQMQELNYKGQINLYLLKKEREEGIFQSLNNLSAFQIILDWVSRYDKDTTFNLLEIITEKCGPSNSQRTQNIFKVLRKPYFDYFGTQSLACTYSQFKEFITYHQIRFLILYKSDLPLIEHLITDSIYCYLEIVKTITRSGIDYISNHSFLGFTHKKLGDWSQYFTLLIQIYQKEDHFHKFINQLKSPSLSSALLSPDVSDSLKTKVREFLNPSTSPPHISKYDPDSRETKLRTKTQKLIGSQNISYLDAKYQYELAKQNFYSALSMHKGGPEYQNMMKKLYFLESDLSDNLMHFAAALERFKINTGEIRRQINYISPISDTSKIFDLESYLSKGFDYT